MKAISVFAVIAALMLTAFRTDAIASESPLTAQIDVTIVDRGALVVAARSVTVTDTDNDGTLTVNDALYAAHDSCYNGGAAAGYASSRTEWGLSVVKLWGDTSGDVSYYVNNVSAWSLEEPVADGNHVVAFIYQDTESYSDTYAWFDIAASEIDENESITLTLLCTDYDTDWNPVAVPVAGAILTVDGVRTAYVTDDDGRVTLTSQEAGEHILSAVSDTVTLVPPVCKLVVTADAASSKATPAAVILFSLAAVCVALTAVILTVRLRRGSHER